MQCTWSGCRPCTPTCPSTPPFHATLEKRGEAWGSPLQCISYSSSSSLQMKRLAVCCFSHSPWQNIFLFLCNSFKGIIYWAQLVSLSESQRFLVWLLQSHEEDRKHGKYFLPLSAEFLLACNCWHAALPPVFLQVATWDIPLCPVAHGIEDVTVLWSTTKYLAARFVDIQPGQAGHSAAEHASKGSAARYPGAGLQGGCWWAGGEDATRSPHPWLGVKSCAELVKEHKPGLFQKEFLLLFSYTVCFTES